MKPLNRTERNNAFLGFLFFFLVTIIIVITVVFYSTKVRFSENERLLSKVSMMQREKNLSDSFRVAMNVVLNEMAVYDSKKDNVLVTKRSVQMKIERMGKLIRSMPDEKSNPEKSIYELVIQNLADLNEAKFHIRNMEDRQ